MGYQPTGYSQAMKSEIFPTKENAILIESISDYSVKDYIKAIAQKTAPENIRFASKISNNRVCIYFATIDLVKEFVVHKTVQIGLNTLNIRPVVNQHKRIILSNVPPIIPHSYILDELHKLNIETTCTAPACFICHTEGHLAKDCPTNKTINPIENFETDKQSNLATQAQQPNSSTQPPNARNLVDKQFLFPTIPSFKRQHDHSLPSTVSVTTDSSKLAAVHIDKMALKKKKEDVEEKIIDPLKLPESVQREMNTNLTKYLCNFNQLQNLYDRTKNQKIIKNIFEEFRIEPILAINMLTSLYPLLNSRGMKSKFTKLRNKIKAEFDIDCDMSLGLDSGRSKTNDFSDIELSDIESDTGSQTA
ncbi:hypothetical protein KQX54_010491 [Cotesia glomerata]|uniref:CCHC-type domain-containing protein n=1 Tax=Cotesia glomerata TaxID=32391 RepID=A0AAV7IJ37_COTGL|nr:hypothetical protein KQX54_010491 [Cotesia glomerata]